MNVRLSDHLSTPEIAQRAGVTYRQIDHWVRTGIIAPAVDAAGPGTRRLWDRADAAKLAVMGRVSKALAVSDNTGAPHHVLVAVAEHWADGRIDVGEGVTVTWTPPSHDRAKMGVHER